MKTKSGKEAKCKRCRGKKEICGSCGLPLTECFSCSITSMIIPCPDCEEKEEAM